MIRPVLIACGVVLSVMAASAGRAPLYGAPNSQDKSVKAGVYTAAQADRGQTIFRSKCASCHAPNRFTDDLFYTSFAGKPLWEMFDVISDTMPEDDPGGLKPQEYADVITYLLKVNDFPSGPDELPPTKEVLSAIRMEKPQRLARHVVSAQAPTKVDFRRDIQPLFKEYCIGCHGPSQQMSGLRLDQRSSAQKPYSTRLQPGSSAYSLIYQRLIDNRYGPQMPLTGALRSEQIKTIKDWIDEGAPWPDDLAGDVAPPAPDPTAIRMMEALRTGDRQAFNKILIEYPKVANLKGPGGSTPLMSAAFYADADAVRTLLDRGADPNLTNQGGATALMWAVADAGKTRLLLDRGADPNARSEEGQTPLAIAATRFGSSAVVNLLLDHGANSSGAALVAAANAGDEAVVRTLVERGAARKASASDALLVSMRAGCAKCVELLIASVDATGLNNALVMLAPFGDTQMIKALLDRGGDVNATLLGQRDDVNGRTPLMLAANSDVLPVAVIKMLIARGAEVNAKGPAGETALDLAKRNGRTVVVDLLIKSGAREEGAFPTPAITPRPATSVRAALERSIPLLQRSDVTFIQKTGCISCHSNTLTAMTVAVARANRFPIDEQIARQQRTTIAALLDSRRDPALLSTGTLTNAASNILVGLAAEEHAPDGTTDAVAYFIKTRQLSDGSWRNWFIDHRPPLQGSDIEVTATSIRALQVYAPQPHRAEYEKAVQRATAWLIKAQPRTTDERALQLLGMKWAGLSADHEAIRRAGRALVREQRSGGGWAQLPTLASDAFATGQTLVALREAGALRVTDRAYQRGVQFLLDTQLEDGSWYVQTRSIPFQPYFESGFPHGPDQWISTAATNWASMALALAAR